jgi:hypothetical protein
LARLLWLTGPAVVAAVEVEVAATSVAAAVVLAAVVTSVLQVVVGAQVTSAGGAVVPLCVVR